MKLTGMCLITTDVLKLSQYYEAVLGIAGQGDSAHMEFSTGGAGLAIFSEAGMEEMAPGSMEGAGRGAAVLMLESEDVDGAYQRMQALGVAFVKPPQTHPWGAWSFWFRDPDGNLVDIYGRV